MPAQSQELIVRIVGINLGLFLGTLCLVSPFSTPLYANPSTQEAAEQFGITASNDKPIKFNLATATQGITVAAHLDGFTTEDEELNHETDFFVPASVIKLITAATALENLGSDFSFKTNLYWLEKTPGVASSLTIQADGDPQVAITKTGKLVPQNINVIPAQLYARGIRSLKDNIHLLAKDERLNIASVAPGVDREDYSNCFGSLTQAFNYEMNCALIGIYRSGATQWADQKLNFSVNPNFSKGSESRLQAIARLDANRVIKSFDIIGTWAEPTYEVPAENPISSARLPISESQSWYGSALLSSFKHSCAKKQGCIQSTNVQVKLNPKDWDLESVQPKLVLQSRPLSTLTNWMLKNSSAFIADALVKALGTSYDDKNQPIRDAGTFVIAGQITKWLEESNQSNLRKEIKFFDGTGFSSLNQVTPRALLALLKHWTTKPYFPLIYNSMPIAGKDGTLARRFQTSKGKNLVRAKTGTLQGYYQMAGYIPVEKNGATRFIPFVILTKTTDTNKDKALELQEKIVDRLVEATRTL
jgi:D-alanyl-D-alanine carboxypeptidase/D-alanyl-D-alanine-endopeptidase (penicillin-binding protein 4)